MRDGFKPQALHEYTDADGTPLHWRIRLKNPDTGNKWIRDEEAATGNFFRCARDVAVRVDYAARAAALVLKRECHGHAEVDFEIAFAKPEEKSQTRARG